ncbi:MAG TPA: alkaline phosphatase family protein [Microthrixaceae bacterium]|nr:alkaline phosphatase family protein [Microthrixaceae bacterium]
MPNSSYSTYFDTITGTGPDAPLPGGTGPGGGRIGALLLSPDVVRGARIDTEYNHYSMLRTIEDIFEVPHLGFAAAKGLAPLDSIIFKKN